MHSHFGLQEQGMMTAPLILNDPAASRRDDQDVVVMLNDFTPRDPGAILADLQGQTSKAAAGGADLSDVRYDALLSNRRPLRRSGGCERRVRCPRDLWIADSRWP